MAHEGEPEGMLKHPWLGTAGSHDPLLGWLEEPGEGEIGATQRATGDPRGDLHLGAVAFRRDMQPLPTCRPAGRKSGANTWRFLSFCPASSASVSHLLTRSEARRQGACPYGSASGGIEQGGGGSSQVRDAFGSGTAWRRGGVLYCQLLFIINPFVS